MERLVISDVVELCVLNKSLGDNNMFRWKIGNTHTAGRVKVKCTRIELDVNSYYFDGQSRWLIYVTPIGGDQEILYVVYENAMVEVKRNIEKLLEK